MKLMMTLVLLAWVTAPVLVAAGEPLPDLTIPNPEGVSQTLRQVTLMKVEPDGLRVMHSAGMAKVPFAALSPELRTKYALVPAQAKPYQPTTAPTSASATPEADASSNTDALPDANASHAPPVKPKGQVKLFTRIDVKASWLTECDPSTIHPLDRDLGKKRAAMMERRTKTLSGDLDFLADSRAHMANANALRDAGQMEAASREEDAAIAATAQYEAATKRAEKEAILKAQKKEERERRLERMRNPP